MVAVSFMRQLLLATSAPACCAGTSTSTSIVVVGKPTKAYELLNGRTKACTAQYPYPPCASTMHRALPGIGFMLDSARHFWSVEQIKTLLDAMATHKLNTFHWHLTDDQGWRIEIKARTPSSPKSSGCRVRRAKAGRKADGTFCPSHYTQEQIREVVACAAARHIIVPEIDVPGHAQAAVAAYPEHGVVDGPPNRRTTGA